MNANVGVKASATFNDMPKDNEAFLVALPADFPREDLLQVAAILEQADVFVPGFIPPEVGLYDITAHVYAAMLDGKTLVLLPDGTSCRDSRK